MACLHMAIHPDWISIAHSYVQKIYYSLQQQKVKSVERVTTITELVVVWSVCSTCTCTVNQRFLWPQLLMQRFTLLHQMLQGVVKLL